MEKVNPHCIPSQENKWMTPVRHKGKQGKDHGKGDEIHHSPDYHSLYIVHSTGQIRMIAAEKIYRNVIADHIIGSHK